MNEIWKPVVGFEGTYEVSVHGHVRRIRQARKEYAEGKPFLWIAKDLKVAPSTIRRAITRQTWQHVV